MLGTFFLRCLTVKFTSDAVQSLEGILEEPFAESETATRLLFPMRESSCD